MQRWHAARSAWSSSAKSCGCDHSSRPLLQQRPLTPPLTHPPHQTPTHAPPTRSQDLVQKTYCLSNLVLRNRAAPLPLLARMQEEGQATPNPLRLPFMLVQAAQVRVGRCEGRGAACQVPLACQLACRLGVVGARPRGSTRAPCAALTAPPPPPPPPRHHSHTRALSPQDADVAVQISDNNLHAHLDFQRCVVRHPRSLCIPFVLMRPAACVPIRAPPPRALRACPPRPPRGQRACPARAPPPPPPLPPPQVAVHAV